MCIFRVLHGDVSHPTAESVHAAAQAHMETISLKTVYQTLNELAVWERSPPSTSVPGVTRSTPTWMGPTTIWCAADAARSATSTPTSAGHRARPAPTKGSRWVEAEVVFRGLAATAGEPRCASTVKATA